ncbi:MAG: 4Fe-4S binding protein [Candidatus Helarchaeota archaeon]|nr:4Fe-4S binding protein [Candidatus Helarchaeota archaeon]
MILDLQNKDLMESVLYAIGIPKDRIKAIKYLPEILQRIMSQEDGKIIAKLGRKGVTLKEAAEVLNTSEEEARQILEEDLFKKKGLVIPFPSPSTGSFKYRATPMLFLHDMCLLNTHFAKDMEEKEKIAFLELWDNFYEEEMIDEFDRLKVDEANLPPIFRVVPVDEEIIPSQEVLAYDTVKGIINKANLISVQPCVCRIRTHGKNCEYPIDVCMGFGFAAKMVIDRGHGRKVSKEEALEIKKGATEAGLVHLSNNASSGFIFICSCCDCCCGALHAIVHHDKTKLGIPSRYQSQIDPEVCIGCETCIDQCNFHAISMEDDKATIDISKCWGCGVCVAVCPEGAATMKLIHDKKQIAKGDAIANLAKYGKQLGVKI